MCQISSSVDAVPGGWRAECKAAAVSSTSTYHTPQPIRTALQDTSVIAWGQSHNKMGRWVRYPATLGKSTLCFHTLGWIFHKYWLNNLPAVITNSSIWQSLTESRQAFATSPSSSRASLAAAEGMGALQAQRSDSCPPVVLTRASANCLPGEPRGRCEACLYISITPRVFYVPLSRNTNNILSKLL